MSQAELAREAGLPVSEISRIERGVREVRLTTMLALVAALGAEPADLLHACRSRVGSREKLRAMPDLSPAEMARELGVSRSSVYRAIECEFIQRNRKEADANAKWDDAKAESARVDMRSDIGLLSADAALLRLIGYDSDDALEIPVAAKAGHGEMDASTVAHVFESMSRRDRRATPQRAVGERASRRERSGRDARADRPAVVDDRPCGGDAWRGGRCDRPKGGGVMAETSTRPRDAHGLLTQRDGTGCHRARARVAETPANRARRETRRYGSARRRQNQLF